MKILTSIFYIIATVVLIAAFVLAAGCANMGPAVDVTALDRGMTRGGELVEKYVDDLPEDEAVEVREAWDQLQSAHMALQRPDADLAWHYGRAKDAYQRLRDVTTRYWDELPAHERRWAEDIDRRAQRLDEQVGQYDTRLRNLLEVAAGATRLLIYAGVL